MLILKVEFSIDVLLTSLALLSTYMLQLIPESTSRTNKNFAKPYGYSAS